MKVLLTYTLVALLFLGTLASCQEPNVQAPRYRLKKSTTSTTSSSSPLSYTTITNYTYNQANQLVSTRTFTGSTYLYAQDDYYLTYNDTGLVSQSEWKQDPEYPGHTLNFYRRYLYTYDAQNRLMEVKANKIVLDKAMLEYEEQYVYGSGKYPTKGVRKNYNDEGTLWMEFTATYSYSQDNVVNVTTTYATGGPSNTIRYQYDTHPNPWYGVLISGGYSAHNLSKNNLLVSGQVYSYNAQELPIKKVQIDGSGQTDYEYETY
ncbi:hypothetical protein GO755_24690 [Spirosoma sp. HMF4905]|uniref:DUF4595 domain-containing protein n=1 Tax=Spirosoma arboris TaxID=2682092 RepID=A0A7K1SHI6_9BACT|nr:hypothetical protein [Spirosoma arboris]MVM33261.1 hypothetical protein [Spirosoma arboris]